MAASFSELIQDLNPEADDYGPALANAILKFAVSQRATDIHLVPADQGTKLTCRIDGVIQSIATFDSEVGQRLVARFKVLAGLLTYRSDVPQEGRIRTGRLASASGVSKIPELKADVRISTFPTLYGEKAAIRIFSDPASLQHLNELGLPDDIHHRLTDLVQQTSGVILLTGPSGSGKTTTIYACLRQMLQHHGTERSVMTLEDPIEVVVPGVTQSQVKPESDFDLATGLKAMLRQDPDVIMIGEIRDADTAEQAFQAALTGHLVLTTYHAGSCAEAVTRLLDMGLEPYLLSSTLRAVVCQRLLRSRCPDCLDEAIDLKSAEISDASDKSQAAANHTGVSRCERCNGRRYRGRGAAVEMMDFGTPGMNRLLSTELDAEQRQQLATDLGMLGLRERCATAVDNGVTDRAEVNRVLGRGPG